VPRTSHRSAATLTQAASSPSRPPYVYKSHTLTFFPIFPISAGTPPPLFPIADGGRRASHPLSSPRATTSVEVQHKPLPVPFWSSVTSSSSHRSRPTEATVERIPRQPPRPSASPRWTIPPRATLRHSELSLPPSPGSTTETERSQVPEASAVAMSLPSSTSWSSVR
jgi:hypothetical protein